MDDPLVQKESHLPVCRFKPRRSFLIFLKFSPTGTGVFSHSGNLVISLFFPLGPTIAVFSSDASPGRRAPSTLELPVTKSVNEGPALSLSLNEAGLRDDVESVAEGSGAAVANERLVEKADVRSGFGAALNGDAYKHRNPLAVAAIGCFCWFCNGNLPVGSRTLHIDKIPAMT
jgi:hypothetical protein